MYIWQKLVNSVGGQSSSVELVEQMKSLKNRVQTVCYHKQPSELFALPKVIGNAKKEGQLQPAQC